MGLSLVNNVASLTAQNNLNSTNGALSKSLERLSTGLKVNRGADGPAALVISEQQRAQISGLRTAIDNTNKAVSVVQTAEGGLNEVNRLLGKVRGLALDSANSGVNDSNALAANQAEINNALNTITNIANTAKFGSKNLLNGQAGITGVVNGANTSNLGNISAAAGIAPGNYAVAVNAATGGTVASAAAGAGAATGAGSLAISGAGLSQPINVALTAGDTAASSAQKIQESLNNSASSGGGAGKFTVSESSGTITINSNVLGSSAITVTASSANVQSVTGFATAGTTGTAGTALTATVNGQAASVSTDGLRNTVTYNGSSGLNFNVGVSNGAATAGTTNIAVADNSLTFQIGANANETAKVSIDKVTADSLGTGVSGLNNATTSDLSKVNVTTANGAQDAIKIVDAAINQVSTLRGKLGAFQANTLESNANNLQTTLQNTTAAESVIRDTDFASEIANFTKFQTQLQAGSTVLGNANQITQLVAGLLRG